MKINITYDDAYFTDDTKIFIAVKNLKINEDLLGDKTLSVVESPIAKLIPCEKMYYELDPDWQLSDEEIFIKIQNLVQNYIDQYAQKMHYDNGFALAGYYDSTNEKFANEAKEFIKFRDMCWTTCYDLLNRYKAGEMRRPLPSEVLNKIWLTKI